MLAILNYIDLKDERPSFANSPPLDGVSEVQPLYTGESLGNRCCMVCATNQHTLYIGKSSSSSVVNHAMPQLLGSNTIVINTETTIPARIATFTEGLMKKPVNKLVFDVIFFKSELTRHKGMDTSEVIDKLIKLEEEKTKQWLG